MIQDTLQRLRSTQHTSSSGAASGGTTLITLGAEQTEALSELLRTLDGRAPHKFIALFGARGSGKSTLINDIATRSAGGGHTPRTPNHRKVVCALVNAATLPSDVAPWQRLIYAVLDTLAQQPGSPQSVVDLRHELDELIVHEQHDDDSAALAGAAFAHHFRAAFGGIIHSAISLANGTFLVVIDHIDKARGEQAAELLEAARYFINAQNCATLMCADEAALSTRLSAAGQDGPAIVAKWVTQRIALRQGTLPHTTEAASASATSPKPAKAQETPKPIASDLPQPCVQILTDALGHDRYAISRAGESWRGAMRALARRNADGYDTRITATLVAKLCALKQLSPALFDAARFDAPLLANLERRARTPQASDTHDEWAETMFHDPRLLALFKAAPTTIGVEPRDVATALRLVHSGDMDDKGQLPSASAATPASSLLTLEPKRPHMRLLGASTAAASPVPSLSAPASAAAAFDAVLTPSARPRPARERQAGPGIALPIWTIISVVAGTFIVDRLVKLAIQGGAMSFGTLVQPTPLSAVNIVSTSLAMGAELVGLALCALIVAYWGSRMRSTARIAAFGLIGGGLAANIFDRVAYGSVMNYLHVGHLPVFNLAHVALIAGACMLGYALLGDKLAEG